MLMRFGPRHLTRSHSRSLLSRAERFGIYSHSILSSHSILFSHRILLLYLTLLTFLLINLPTSLCLADSQIEHRLAPQKYDGLIISSIDVEIRDIFTHLPRSWFYDTINDLKISTKKRVVRREVLFKEGELYDHFKVNESLRNLRRLSFLRNVRLKVTEQDSVVHLMFVVQDAWTLVPQAGLSSSSGRKSRRVGLSDSNLFGFGKRLEFRDRKVNNQETFEIVYDDPRVWGSFQRGVIGYFDRNDGERFLLDFSRPFRTLINKSSWRVSAERSNTVGRLFENGDEEYIFRRKFAEFQSRYTFSLGKPKYFIRRISFGFDLRKEDFFQAREGDYDALDLDPAEVSNDPSRLATDKRFYGPVFGYESITPEFISANYIDRFDRVEDYNLGAERSLLFHFASKVFGSSTNSLIISGNRSSGYKIGASHFLRGELGLSTRISRKTLRNSLFRSELRYYNNLGFKKVGSLFLGNHTLAGNLSIDYGDDFDNDRQLLLGNDQGALRGYKAQAFSGNKRIIATFEDRIHIYEHLFRLISLGANVFADIGGASDQSVNSMLQHDIYANVGVGLLFGFPRSSGGGVLRVELALPLRTADDGTDAFSPRLLITAGQPFSARLRSESAGTERANVAIDNF